MSQKRPRPVRPPNPGPNLDLEGQYPGWVCGVDEAGRGPWAGAVFAAAVILDPQAVPEGVNDSKKLTSKARDRLEAAIKASALAWAVAEASVDEIAEHNIVGATGLAMARAVAALALGPDMALVDGNIPFPLPCPVRTVIRGDALSLSVAAASILAKTARDREMAALDRAYPGYGFAEHKGYGVPKHAAALRRLGPCPAHRAGWAPIRASLRDEPTDLDEGGKPIAVALIP